MVLNIALNLYFIPQYSYLAAAVITGISEVVILLLTVYLSRDWSSLDKQSERIRS
jgi:O-antigen/teichoic acid export membrane protein